VHARVDFRLAQVLDDRSHGGRLDAADVADDVVGGDFGEVAADAQHEARVRGHRRLTPEQHVQRREADDRHEERDAEQREEDGETTAGHSRNLAEPRTWLSGHLVIQSL
jgi:hypothetical protein